MIKKFKEYLIKESIIDIPRRTYAPGVFDNADTENPKLKSEIIGIIMKQFTDFKKEYPILEYSLIGSILTKRYRNDADLDVNVLFDIPEEKQEEERIRLSKKFLSTSTPNNIQSKLIPGTKHPINYYFITNKKTYDEQNEKADAVFNIGKNEFIKRPKEFTFDVNLYMKEFEKKVQELDGIKGELKRDIIDYNELIELQPNDILNLQDKINNKLEEIENSIEDIIKVGDQIELDRRTTFNTDMTPEEIRQYGIKNRLPKNVIYKMLEKYHYLKFYKKCKQILDDGKITDDEIKSLTNEDIDNMNEESIASTWNDFQEAITLKGIKKSAQRPKSIAFTFGRFNPPTIGHEKLITKVLSLRANSHKIYLSRSEDSKKNPLSPNIKFQVMKDMFKYARQNLEISPTNMILDLVTKIYNQGFTDITMVAGSDRVSEFENILNKYNDVKSRHGYYNFDNINIVSAGERDPDAEGTTGISASKMRDAATKGDTQEFQKGLPISYRSPLNVTRLMGYVRVGMRLAETVNYLDSNNKPVLSMEEFGQKQIRDLYLRNMMFNIGEKVDYTKQNIQGTVKRKGTNYIVLEDNNNNLHKAWIWDCVPISSDKEVALREHNLNIDYGFEAVSEKKYNEIFDDLKKKIKMKLENESYEIGADYANHTKEITPGQTPEAIPVDAKEKGLPTQGHKNIKIEKITEKDVDNWASQDETIDKYRERYGDNYQQKIQEVKNKMLSLKDFAKE